MEGCACVCPECEQASWRPFSIVVYGGSESRCPELGTSFHERLVPGFLGSNVKKEYRSIFPWHCHLLVLGFFKECTSFFNLYLPLSCHLHRFLNLLKILLPCFSLEM